MDKLTQRNYHSVKMNKAYMGTSQIKSFMECEARALAEVKRTYTRQDSKALIAGQYFDSLFDGTYKKFIAKNQSKLFSKSGEPYSHIVQAMTAYKRVQRDHEMLRLCTGEQQQIYTGLIQGVPVKIMVDSLLPDMIVDRKLMASFPDAWRDGEYVQWWKAYRYDIQAAIYTEIYEQNTDNRLPFVLAAVSKEKEPDMRVCMFTENTIENAFGEVLAIIERIQAIKQGEETPRRCGECDYCRKTKVIKKGAFELI